MPKSYQLVLRVINCGQSSKSHKLLDRSKLEQCIWFSDRKIYEGMWNPPSWFYVLQLLQTTICLGKLTYVWLKHDHLKVSWKKWDIIKNVTWSELLDGGLQFVVVKAQFQFLNVFYEMYGNLVHETNLETCDISILTNWKWNEKNSIFPKIY